MPQQFDLTSIVSKTRQKPIKRRYKAKTTYQKSLTRKIYLFFTTIPSAVWISFYIILILNIFLSTILIDKTNIAGKIMDKVRQQELIANPPQKKETDLSSFSLSTDPGMVAVITFPDGKRSGDTAEGIRYIEAQNVSISNPYSIATSSAKPKSDLRWGIFADQPSEGVYLVEFSAKFPGNYTYILKTYDQSGLGRTLISDLVSMNLNEHKVYRLNFFKNKSSLIRFIFQEPIKLSE